MATGMSASIHGASDVIYDYKCSLCESDNLNNDANFYCGQCSQFMCAKCEKFHGKFHASHHVLGRKDVRQWGEVKKSVSMVTCEEHMNKYIEMYCGDHDQVCSTICVSKYHMTCKRVEDIIDVAKGIRQTRNFKGLLEKERKMNAALQKSLSEKEKNRGSLQESCKEFIDTLDEIQREFSDTIEALKKTTIEDLDKLMTELDQTIQSDVDTVSKLDGDIGEYMKIILPHTIQYYYNNHHHHQQQHHIRLYHHFQN